MFGLVSFVRTRSELTTIISIRCREGGSVTRGTIRSDRKWGNKRKAFTNAFMHSLLALPYKFSVFFRFYGLHY